MVRDAREPRASGGRSVQTPELTRREEFPPPSSRRPFVKGAPDGPPVPPEVQKNLLYHMMMTREVDDRIEKKLYRQGKIVGGVYTGRGQEAISVAFTLALKPKDYIIPSHRDMGVYITRGLSLYKIFAQYLGRRDGPARGKDGNMHMGDLRLGLVSFVSMLADSVPIVAGAGMAFRFRNEPRIAITFNGEGSTSRGDWHEGINLAAVQKANCVFVVNNNAYAYSTPTDSQYACENLADRAIGYGIDGYLIDGNDAEAVYRTALQVCEKARTGGGPSIVECVTFRMTGHSAHDDPSHYVPDELFPQWEKRDPIARLTHRMVERGVIDQAWVATTSEEIRTAVDKAVEQAEACPFPDPSEATTDVYYDPTRPIVNQEGAAD
jgi:pyruvate dehydrogenase E1 component alpha subunit